MRIIDITMIFMTVYFLLCAASKLQGNVLDETKNISMKFQDIYSNKEIFDK